MRRRLLLISTLLLTAFGVIVVTIPWWFGGVLRYGGASRGLTFGSYERLGYARFFLQNAEYERGAVRVTVSRVEADTPAMWLWRHVAGRSAPVVAGQWAVEVGPNRVATLGGPVTASGWAPLQETLQRVAAQLDRWLPRAQVGPGAVQWPGGGVSLAAATWERRTLAATGVHFKALQADATLEFPLETHDLRLSANFGEGQLAARSEGENLTGQFTWWDQKGELAAKFGPSGWLPAEASLRANSWRVPGDKLKLAGFYSVVRGDVSLDWREERLQADIAIKGDPVEGKSVPPLEVTLRGIGDPQAFTVEKFRASLPGVVADLTEAVTVERSGNIRESGARFTLQLDLAQQPWFPAQGRVTGDARLTSSLNQSPVVEFNVQAQEIRVQKIAVSSVVFNGRFDWPRIILTKGVVIGPGGEQVQGVGGWDLRNKELLAAKVDGQIRRETVARWLPAQPQFRSFSFAIEGAGAWENLQHRGEASADAVTFTGVKPMQVKLSWRGNGLTVPNFTADVSAGDTTVAMAGSGNPEAVELSTLRLAQKEALLLQLTRPVTIRWKPVLTIGGLHLAGNASSIDAELTWGAVGKVAIALRNFPSIWLAPLTTVPGPQWDVQTLALHGAWDHGPMTFSTVVGATVELGEKRTANVNLAARGSPQGIKVEALRAADGPDPIVNAVGLLPIVLAPGSVKLVSIEPRGQVELDADTAPNAAFWGQLAAMTGLELKTPRVAAHVRGTWSQPTGTLQIQAGRIALDPKRFKRSAPAMESLDVAIRGDSAGLQLERLAVQLEGQSLSASGRLPIGETDWAKLFKTPVAFIHRSADLRLEIPEAEIAAFARFLPAFMAPKGRVHLDLAYRGGRASGSVRLSDAATRPLGPLGVLQEVQADVALVNNVVELRNVTAKSGGEEVRLAGRVALPDWNLGGDSVAGGRGDPKFELTLKGDNLPFVRRTGLLLRGDLDLNLTTNQNGIVRLGGKVRLRDSLFLQDVRALLPSGTASKSRRPPFFAVENAPLNEWLLDLSVEGDRFLRVRTALFNGVASARFHLGGTLGEPMALGEMTINQGAVRLPFATFDVREGRVTLTPEQPYEPQLWLAATSRRFNYDMRMEATGAAVAPILTFSSSPPLEHGQVLLMVMTGQAPKDEIAFTDQQRAARLGTFLGQSLLASFGESENAERLNISTGEKVSARGRETYDIEYRFNEKWSVTGEYDEFDNYNVGVKWRVYSRGGERPAEGKDETKK